MQNYLDKLRAKSLKIREVPLPKKRGFLIPLPYERLCIEVGCGVGWHPMQFANKYPNQFLVAIEHTAEKFQKFYGRFLSHQSPANILPLHENAISWISHSLQQEQVDHYYFLYPNPNPKAGDRNKRWYAMPFMGKVIETLKIGGTLELASNESFYINEAIYFMEKAWGMKLLSNEVIKDNPRTHFEKKYIQSNQTCINLIFQKLK